MIRAKNSSGTLCVSAALREFLRQQAGGRV